MEKKLRIIETGLDERNKKFNEILRSVIGQLSDGMWENCSRYKGYWTFDEATGKDNKIIVSNEAYEWDRNWSRTFKNPYYKMTDQEIRKFFANKIKYLVKAELKSNYEYDIAEEIFKKYSLEEYCRMYITPLDHEEEYNKAKEETEKYLKDNPFTIKGKFNDSNTESLLYLNYDEDVQVKDAYEVYQALMNFETEKGDN